MREEEPLEGWLFLAKMRAGREPAPYQQRAGGAALSQLAQALAAQPEGKVNYNRISGTLGTYDRVALKRSYGDSHEFIVTVLGIETRADDGSYPRVIESRGKAPRQYYSYEDEDDDNDGS